MRSQNRDDVKKEISDWVTYEDKMFPSVLRLIELDDKIIGFIANTPAGYDDELKSGFKMLINYAISEEFEGNGYMSKALKCSLMKCIKLNSI
jgi:RimJ/RimL family protein N-acetyltransferase